MSCDYSFLTALFFLFLGGLAVNLPGLTGDQYVFIMSYHDVMANVHAFFHAGTGCAPNFIAKVNVAFARRR